MILGPLTRQALIKAGIDDERIKGIEEGIFEWTIGPAPTYAIASSAEIASQLAEDAVRRKDFAIKISRTEAEQARLRPYDLSRRARRVYESTLSTAEGQRLAGIRRYEGTLGTRGSVSSVLFEEGTPEDWTAVAVAPSWDAAAFEFRQAAESLAKTGTDDDAVPMLPLLTLCRHHLELSLKAIIMSGDALAGNPLSLPAKHQLMPLWNRAVPLMRSAWKREWVETDATDAKRVIAEFDAVDPDSMSTRYPVDKSNNAFPRPPQLLNFSVAKFMATFASTADFLGSAILWIEVGSRLKAEGIASDD